MNTTAFNIFNQINNNATYNGITTLILATIVAYVISCFIGYSLDRANKSLQLQRNLHNLSWQQLRKLGRESGIKLSRTTTKAALLSALRKTI